MSRLFRYMLIFLLFCFALASACGKSGKAPMALDPAVQEMCDDYLRLHPDGPFIEQIRARELAKGMSTTHVFLSWGRPLHREKDGDIQTWLYEFDIVPSSQQKRVANLFFEGGHLREWYVDRGFVFFIDLSQENEFVPSCVDMPTKTPQKGLIP